MKVLGKLIFAGLVIFALLQVVRPTIPAKPPTAELQALVEVKQVLRKAVTAATRTSGGSRGLTRSCPGTGWCAMTS